MVEIRQFEEGWGGPSRREIDEILDEGAIRAGHPFTYDQRVFVAEEDGAMLGGLAATVSQYWMHVDLLAVREEARGRGIGRRLLEEAETFARALGLVGIYLDTYGFQAPEYYPRLGFREFGRLPDQPPGHERVFFMKRLEGEGA